VAKKPRLCTARGDAIRLCAFVLAALLASNEKPGNRPGDVDK